MKRPNIVVESIISSLSIVMAMHCSPDDRQPTAATGGNGGKAGTVLQAGNGGASAGAVAVAQGGSAGSQGSEAGTGARNGDLPDAAAPCTGSMPSGTLHGSCDARSTAGDSQGRCREWYGAPNAGLTFACPNGDGQYFAGVACPTERRVGRCVLPFAAIDVETVLIYYAPTFDAATAKSACFQVGGTCIP